MVECLDRRSLGTDRHRLAAVIAMFHHYISYTLSSFSPGQSRRYLQCKCLQHIGTAISRLVNELESF
jgi:hypothetical protein